MENKRSWFFCWEREGGKEKKVMHQIETVATLNHFYKLSIKETFKKVQDLGYCTPCKKFQKKKII
jgi:hypothetical protein